MVGGCCGLRAGRDAEHFSIGLKTPKVVENCLKTTFVAEVSGVEVPKKRNPLRLLSALFHMVSSPVMPPLIIAGNGDAIGKRG
jgi:hypothetical protein